MHDSDRPSGGILYVQLYINHLPLDAVVVISAELLYVIGIVHDGYWFYIKVSGSLRKNPLYVRWRGTETCDTSYQTHPHIERLQVTNKHYSGHEKTPMNHRLMYQVTLIVEATCINDERGLTSLKSSCESSLKSLVKTERSQPRSQLVLGSTNERKRQKHPFIGCETIEVLHVVERADLSYTYIVRLVLNSWGRESIV